MKKLLEKKINYAEEAEAPMILGTKILKRLKKDWGEDSDIYYEIEDILINFGSDSPRRLAMALKRVLNNYDMWESPYKGYVNKIEKWTKPTGKVNESRDEEIRKSRFDSLVEKIEYYSYMFDKNGTLSKEQISDLLNVRDTIMVFGTYGAKWASFADEILQDCGCDKYSISKLCQDDNGLWESYTPMSDEEYLDKFLSICEENNENKITLYFDDVDAYMIEKRFGDRFKKYLKIHKDDDIRYKAQFVMPNGGYGEEPKCVLTALEYGGYGVSSNYLCDLSFEEFDRLLKNFTHSAGDWHRNDTFMYESNNPISKPLFRTPVKFVKTYKDEVFEILDELLKKGEIGYEDLEYICNNEAIYDEVIDYIIKETSYGDKEGKIKSMNGYRHNILKHIEEYYEIMLSNHLKDIEEDEIKESLSYKRDNEEYDEVYDSFYSSIDDFLKDETLTESDLYLMVKDGVHYDDLKPFIIYSLGMMVEYLSEEDEEFYRGVLEDAVNDYYNNDFRIEEALSKPLFRKPVHLEDINESEENAEEKPKKKTQSKDRPGALNGGDYISKKDNKKDKKKSSGIGMAALGAVAAGGIYTLKKAGDVLVKSFQ